MTTARLQKAPPPSPLQRMVKSWRGFFLHGDLTSLLITTVLLIIPPLSLNAAEWPLQMQVILPITALGVLFGLVLARSQFDELLALVISITYGFCMVLLLTALSLDGNFGQNVYDVFLRTAQWIVDATTGGINQDDMVFTLLVALLFWFLGYNAAWHVFRVDRVWRVILPPGLILVTNVVFYNGENTLDLYMVAFLFLSLLLVARSNLDNREWDWYQNGMQVPRRLRRQFLRMGALLAIVALILGAIIPSSDVQERLDRFQEFLQSDPLQEMSEFWNRLFSPIDAQGPTTADYYGGDSLELGGAIRLGDQPVFWVDAPRDRRYYWRSRVFDTYEAGRWTPAADTRLTDSTAPFEVIVEQNASRQMVEQTFTVALNSTRILYAAPQPLQVDLPTRTDLFYINGEVGDPNREMSVSVIRPTEVLRRGETYTAQSLMSVATANELRAASTAYPEWVTSLYLYVSPSVTPRTIQLAQQIVIDAGASNPYDQAKAIEGYLRQNIVYNESIPAPPPNQDPVDWVLFDYQEGYCNYYASAMIVMLRSLGIPARMAAGFAQGNFDAAENAYVVTERDAHTWVEAYFPNYGWIEFEPTAAQLPIERQGDDTPVSPEQIAPAQATATPTLTPTPLPTATPNATATPPENEQNVPPQPTATPTITPTFTPSPTATPVIVPTQPPPLTPDADNPFEAILPAIGVFLLILLLIMVVVAIALFTYWWWEWRGMRGLSPISRAYARLERYLALIGMRFGGQSTPEERRYQIVRTIPKAERPVTAITRLYTTERYGPGVQLPTDTARDAEVVDKAWSYTRRNILQRWARRFQFWKRDW